MKRFLLLLVIVVVAVALAFISLPEDPGRMETPAPIPETPITADKDEDETTEQQSAVETERDARLAAMKELYADLERERRNLRQRLNKVRYYLAEADLADTRAEKVQEELDSANRLLINPPLLGAFRGVDGIQQELDRIARINERLDEIEVILGAPAEN